MRRCLGLVLVVCLLVARPAISPAAEDEIEPDRPDVTNAPTTVPPGVIQLETGVAYQYTRLGGQPAERRLSVESALRLGLTERLEARVEGEPLVHLDNAEHATDVGEIRIGLKYRFLDAASGRPALGVQPFVTLPVAEPPVASGRPSFGAIGLARFDLPAELTLDVNAGAIAAGQRSPDGYVFQAVASASMSRDFGGISPFVEVFFQSRETRNDRDAVGLDAGLVARLSPALAVDVSVTTSLMGRLPDWALRTGASVRFGR